MEPRPVELTGGESVYCINEAQLRAAYDLAMTDRKSSAKIQQLLSELETRLTRNERAALAFILIDYLLKYQHDR